MNKTEDDELGNEELSDEEIRALSEGLFFISGLLNRSTEKIYFLLFVPQG